VPESSKPKTARERGRIVALQDEIRNAINVSRKAPHSKSGVQPKDLKRTMRQQRIDVSRITVRAQHLPSTRPDDLEADYKLWLDGELLFRIKLVTWEGDFQDARWHVKRHPDATWYRSASSRARGR
jgi:hypothetical protein